MLNNVGNLIYNVHVGPTILLFVVNWSQQIMSFKCTDESLYLDNLNFANESNLLLSEPFNLELDVLSYSELDVLVM